MSRTATATLIRGRTYIFKDKQFYANEPVTVSEEFGKELEDLVDEVRDAEGEVRNKARFKVTYAPTNAIRKISNVKTLPGKKLQTSAKPGVRIKRREA
jgi:hypothetical protein